MSRLVPFAGDYDGSRGFRRAHRKALRRVMKALNEAKYGCAYAPSYDDLRRIDILLKNALLNCKEENWE